MASIASPFKFLWKLERICQKHIIDDVKSLGKLRRIVHPKVKKHWVGIGVGVMIAAGGSTVALAGAHQTIIPHPLWDTGAYLIHGFGSIPILKHGEVIWKVLFAVE